MKPVSNKVLRKSELVLERIFISSPVMMIGPIRPEAVGGSLGARARLTP
jgi:hypothetical protein